MVDKVVAAGNDDKRVSQRRLADPARQCCPRRVECFKSLGDVVGLPVRHQGPRVVPAHCRSLDETLGRSGAWDQRNAVRSHWQSSMAGFLQVLASSWGSKFHSWRRAATISGTEGSAG